MRLYLRLRRVDASTSDGISVQKVPCGACQRCLGGENRSVNLDHFRLKPHLREIFRDLDVTSRPALQSVSDGQLHRVASSVRVYRRRKCKKREKRKNGPQKMLEKPKIVQNRPKMSKIPPVFPVQTRVTPTLRCCPTPILQRSRSIS
jgi:hypothetical protein